MTSCLIAFAVALLISLCSTFLVKKMGHALGWVDHPDAFRKIHTEPIPRIGGLGILVAVVAPYLLLRRIVPDNILGLELAQQQNLLIALGAGALVSTGMGLYDDVRSLLARYKIFWQAVAACIAWYGGLMIETVQLPLYGQLALPVGLSIAATVLWYLVCMNAVNLLDGLDGLAAGICLLTTVTMFLVSLSFNNATSMFLAACVAGALLGFLFFNFYPAKIFLGDSGSMLLGFMVASLSIYSSRQAETVVSIIIPIIALGVPIIDTVVAILRRWSQKLPLSAPDRQHIHHRLIGMGISHKRAVLYLYAACVVFGVGAFLLTINRDEVALMVIGCMAIIVFVSIRVFGKMRLREISAKLGRSWRRGRLDAHARATFERARTMMLEAENVSGVWEQCILCLDALGIDGARLTVYTRDGREDFVWPEDEHVAGSNALPMDEEDHWAARLKLKDADGAVLGELLVMKTVEGDHMLTAVPELVARLRQPVARAVERLADLGGTSDEGAAPGVLNPTV